MELRYHNPNFGVRILGRANESEIEIDTWERRHHWTTISYVTSFCNSVHGRQRNTNSGA